MSKFFEWEWCILWGISSWTGIARVSRWPLQIVSIQFFVYNSMCFTSCSLFQLLLFLFASLVGTREAAPPSLPLSLSLSINVIAALFFQVLTSQILSFMWQFSPRTSGCTTFTSIFSTTISFCCSLLAWRNRWVLNGDVYILLSQAW